MKKYLETIVPIVCDLKKAFPGDENLSGREYLESKQIGSLDCGDIVSGIEIPLEVLIENGFTVRAYLKKDNKENPAIVDKKTSGVIVISIQNMLQEKSYMQDAISLKLDARSELEISTLITNLVEYEKPGALKGFDLNVFHQKTRENLEKIEEKEKFMLEQRNKFIDEYLKDPEKAKKETKKLIDNMRYKQKELNNNKNKTQKDIKKFQDDLFVMINKLCLINGNIKTFEELKLIPEVAAEIEKGSDIAKVIDVLSNIVQIGQMDSREEEIADKAFKKEDDILTKVAGEESEEVAGAGLAGEEGEEVTDVVGEVEAKNCSN